MKLSEVIAATMPNITAEHLATFTPHIAVACKEYGIDNPARVAAFLATVAAETGELETFEENLNYSARGLAATWPNRYAEVDANGDPRKDAAGHYIPNTLAYQLHRRPEAIANNCYADRMGNGPEASGDGWRFRGSGALQETGKDNHYAAALHFDIELEKIGEWLRSPEGAMRSAAWGFSRRGCNDYADRGDFDGVSDLVNRGRKTARIGDAIGYPERLAFFNAAKEALA